MKRMDQNSAKKQAKETEFTGLDWQNKGGKAVGKAGSVIPVVYQEIDEEKPSKSVDDSIEHTIEEVGEIDGLQFTSKKSNDGNNILDSSSGSFV